MTDDLLHHQQLQEEISFWKLLMERSNDGIVVLDTDGLTVAYANPAFAQMLGYTVEEVSELHPWDWDADHSRAEIEAMSIAHRNMKEERRFESRHRRKDGSIYNVEILSTPAEKGDKSFMFCYCRDITAQNQAKESLLSREQEFRSLAENSPDAIVRYDRRLYRLYVNPAFERLVGKSRDWLIGRHISSEGQIDLPIYQAALQRVFETGVSQEAELRHIQPDGSIVWLHPRFEPEFDKDDKVQSVLAVIRDMRSAFTDVLTGLPNRALFERRFREAVSGPEGCEKPLAFLLLDIDHFKDINDTLGHKAGDELLRQVTGRLSNCVRESDTIARMGDDEFAILLPFENAEEPNNFACRILQVLAQPFFVNGQELFISGSIGIAFYPRDSIELNELFAFADAAMFSAKRKGRNTFQIYSPEFSHRTMERLSLGSALRHACDKAELLLLHQPKVLLRTGQVVGTEALLRWRHPQQGLLSPLQFIPIAEETGLILSIGQWVLRNACREAVILNRHSSSPLKVAVNLSCRQFIQHDLTGEVETILRETGCRAQWLELEITESLMLDEHWSIRKTLKKLRGLGITIAIDDFGTGYSALDYLRRFPMDVLKIDRSFVDGIDQDPRKAGLVKAFIAVAHALQMEIVAEGIETEAQRDLLQTLGCRLGQGFLFGKPQTLETLIAGRP
ncbi:MAG: EAL domain-containing protein [Syntrophotaleaceae bacterium]